MAVRFWPAAEGLVAPPTIAALMLLYLLAVGLLRRFMSERQPMRVVAAMRVYNVLQVVLCLYMSMGLLPTLWNAPPFEFKLFNVSIPNIFAISAPFSADAEYFVIIHYLSKVLDFCDTFFIILRKSKDQLTFLHVYHHSTIIAIWGFLLHIGFGSGAVSFGAFLNSFVHVLMYSHYLLTSFGLRNPFKLVLTKIQISQFYLCLTQGVLVAMGLDAHYPTQLAWLQLGYHISMVVLFSNFLWRSQKKSKEL